MLPVDLIKACCASKQQRLFHHRHPRWQTSKPGDKGLFANYMDKISLRFGSDLVVAISAKPQA
jgi:hypothetical protein